MHHLNLWAYEGSYIIYLIIIYLASQMWLLGRILPILIGDLVLEDNEYWILFLKLMDTVDILFSPTIIEDDCA